MDIFRTLFVLLLVGEGCSLALLHCGVCQCSNTIVYCAGKNLTTLPRVDQLESDNSQRVRILSLQVSILHFFGNQ